jgi:hypothetical protein
MGAGEKDYRESLQPEQAEAVLEGYQKERDALKVMLT